MRMLLVLFFSVQLFAQDYTKLRQYKAENPTQKNLSIEQSSVNNSLNYEETSIVVRFKDINSFNFFNFEEIYKVELKYCIAHGICVFKNNSTVEINSLVDNIKRETTDFKNVKIYRKYKMRTF